MTSASRETVTPRPESVSACVGGDKTKPPETSLQSPFGRRRAPRIRRYAPIEFIGRFLPHFFKGLASPTKSTRQKPPTPRKENALGTLAAAVDKTIRADRHADGRHGVRRVQYPVSHLMPREWFPRVMNTGDAGIRKFHGDVRGPGDHHHHRSQENACSKAKVTKRSRSGPERLRYLFGRFLMDIGGIRLVGDISANLPPYTEEVVSVRWINPWPRLRRPGSRTSQQPFKNTAAIRRW